MVRLNTSGIHPRPQPLLLALAIAGSLACGSGDLDAPVLPREPWVDRPVAEWPDFALSNEVVFTDTAYSYLANAFAVDTGADTVGATCKHIFMVFRNQRGITTVAFEDDFAGWSLRSSRDSARVLGTRRLVNADPTEPVGDFASIKDRDWLVFELDGWSDGVYPLKVRYTPLEVGETIYAVGRSLAGRHDPDPAPSPLRVYRAAGTYYYVQPLDPSVDPEHTSGSPVIDENGYLVGLVSGAVGRLGVVAGVAYLRQLFDRHEIAYRVPTPDAGP
jgi:hypothetical protein